jgi:hypothetical protein
VGPNAGTPENITGASCCENGRPRAERRLLPVLPHISSNRQQGNPRRQLHLQAGPPNIWENGEGGDRRDRRDARDDRCCSRSERASCPNERNNNWLGRPTGADGGVARLPLSQTQTTPPLNRRDLEIFERDWHREGPGSEQQFFFPPTRQRRRRWRRETTSTRKMGQYTSPSDHRLINFPVGRLLLCRARSTSHVFVATSGLLTRLQRIAGTRIHQRLQWRLTTSGLPLQSDTALWKYDKRPEKRY